MNCQVCSQETILPFICPYCGGQFCAPHRLPENHACSKINVARTQRQEQVMTTQNHSSFNYSYVFGQDSCRRQYPIHFSEKELKHLAVAALLVIGIGFSIGLYGNLFGGFLFEWTWDMMAIFAVVMTASFLTHEIAHKVVAQKRGLWAEFRLTTWGALITFASIFLPFRFIAPGAMMIGGSLQKNDDIVKISLAGPITNIFYGSIFFGFAIVLVPSFYGYSLLMFFAAYINAFMAVFNLIPFGVLDGYKIFSFNKTLWALVFVPSLILAIVTFLQI
jgi:Zn-dependent protease